MEIINKTKRPLRIPLPGGKKLHLGPGNTGQISPKAAQHPPLKKMADEGEVEIVDDGRSRGKGHSNGGAKMGSSQASAPNRGLRHTGDR